jgi:hypothetical protein
MLLPWNGKHGGMEGVSDWVCANALLLVFITASEYFAGRFKGSSHQEDFQSYFSTYFTVTNMVVFVYVLWKQSVRGLEPFLFYETDHLFIVQRHLPRGCQRNHLWCHGHLCRHSVGWIGLFLVNFDIDGSHRCHH